MQLPKTELYDCVPFIWKHTLFLIFVLFVVSEGGNICLVICHSQPHCVDIGFLVMCTTMITLPLIFFLAAKSEYFSG